MCLLSDVKSSHDQKRTARKIYERVQEETSGSVFAVYNGLGKNPPRTRQRKVQELERKLERCTLATK